MQEAHLVADAAPFCMQAPEYLPALDAKASGTLLNGLSLMKLRSPSPEWLDKVLEHISKVLSIPDPHPGSVAVILRGLVMLAHGPDGKRQCHPTLAAVSASLELSQAV